MVAAAAAPTDCIGGGSLAARPDLDSRAVIHETRFGCHICNTFSTILDADWTDLIDFRLDPTRIFLLKPVFAATIEADKGGDDRKVEIGKGGALILKSRDSHASTEKAFQELLRAVPNIEVFTACWMNFVAIIQWFNAENPDVIIALVRFGHQIMNLSRIHTWSSILKTFTVYAREHMTGTFDTADWYQHPNMGQHRELLP